MLQNYEYFLVLSEEQNISRAAKKLYISHQCLSRYLKNLEDECGLPLFERKPKFTLTYAGRVLADSLLEIQRTERNALHAFQELKHSNSGEIRLGVTEGRLRIIIPDLLKVCQEVLPNIMIKAVSAPSPEMLAQLSENKLDVVIAGQSSSPQVNLVYRPLLTEKLYLVISDNLLRRYFPDNYPLCKEEFSQGADLVKFQCVPFILNYPGFSSRQLLDTHLSQRHLALNIVHEATQPDLQHIMAAQDYAATTCLTMYIPGIRELNKSNPQDNQLNIFPIKGLDDTNSVSLITVRGKYFPQYAKQLFSILKQQCECYSKLTI